MFATIKMFILLIKLNALYQKKTNHISSLTKGMIPSWIGRNYDRDRNKLMTTYFYNLLWEIGIYFLGIMIWHVI